MSEIEYSSITACKFVKGKIETEELEEKCWEGIPPDEFLDDDDDVDAYDDSTSTRMKCIFSSPLSRVRITPMERIGGRRNKHSSSAPPKWKSEEHFHPDLKITIPKTKIISTNSDNNDESTKDDDDDGQKKKKEEEETETSREVGMIVVLEAMARESLILALSPSSKFVSGKTYEICFGYQGNTCTTIRRHLPGQKDSSLSLSVSRPSPRICHEKSWKTYWVCYSKGKVYAGIGNIPGQDTIVILDDIARQDTPPILVEDMIKYVGIGNAGVTDRQAATPLKVRNIRLCPVPIHIQTQLQSIQLEELDATMTMMLDHHTTTAGGDSLDNMSDEMDETTKKIWEKYQDECKKAQVRAQKFGLPYKEPPPPSAILSWSHARKLKANPTAGFVTGIDMMSEAEKAKQEARAKRFGIMKQQDGDDDKEEREAGSEDRDGADDNDGGDNKDDRKDHRRRNNNAPFPVEQAWDNVSLVGRHRVDPPKNLWKVPPPDAGDGSTDAASGLDEFRMDVEIPTIVPEKIHIFSIDWAAFKQIRTNDVMRHFSIYGPSYVEWLGDLSANIHFEDKYSAARAIENLSQVLPTPPPPPQSNPTNASGDDGGDDDDVKTPAVAVGGENENEVEDKEDKDKVKQQDVEEQDGKENPSTDEAVDSKDKMKKEDSNEDEKGGAESESEKNDDMKDPPPPLPDLGAMGWRFGNAPLRKIANDKYGRRGTTARILMRLATSLDILDQRPSSWPKPPPGFTTKRVLGPGSDFPKRNKKREYGDDNKRQHNRDDDNDNRGRRNKRRQSQSDDDDDMNNEGRGRGGRQRKRNQRQSDSTGNNDGNKNDAQTLLTSGLRSTRAGFSVEEMEAERARKRVKTEDLDAKADDTEK